MAQETALKIAQEEMCRIWQELWRVDQEFKAQQQDLIKAMEADKSPELLDLIREEKDRLADKEKEMWQHLTALHEGLASLCEVPYCCLTLTGA